MILPDEDIVHRRNLGRAQRICIDARTMRATLPERQFFRALEQLRVEIEREQKKEETSTARKRTSELSTLEHLCEN